VTNRTRIECDGFEVREASNDVGQGHSTRNPSLLFLAQNFVLGLVVSLPRVARVAGIPVDTKQVLLHLSSAVSVTID
jgi:hypothetical protein